jgi:hypothetical protein
LALARCSDIVENNASHIDVMPELSGKAIGKDYRLEKYIACGWMQICLEVMTERVECLSEEVNASAVPGYFT